MERERKREGPLTTRSATRGEAKRGGVGGRCRICAMQASETRRKQRKDPQEVIGNPRPGEEPGGKEVDQQGSKTPQEEKKTMRKTHSNK